MSADSWQPIHVRTFQIQVACPPVPEQSKVRLVSQQEVGAVFLFYQAIIKNLASFWVLNCFSRLIVRIIK